jgi:hypothetical protein
MTTVMILGDGPAGLSAAVFLAKNGCDTHVFGKDTTSNHKALLLNYLGIERIKGTDFQKIARAQAEHYGARLYNTSVIDVQTSNGAPGRTRFRRLFPLVTEQPQRSTSFPERRGRTFMISIDPDAGRCSFANCCDVFGRITPPGQEGCLRHQEK